MFTARLNVLSIFALASLNACGGSGPTTQTAANATAEADSETRCHTEVVQNTEGGHPSRIFSSEQDHYGLVMPDSDDWTIACAATEETLLRATSEQLALAVLVSQAGSDLLPPSLSMAEVMDQQLTAVQSSDQGAEISDARVQVANNQSVLTYLTRTADFAYLNYVTARRRGDGSVVFLEVRWPVQDGVAPNAERHNALITLVSAFFAE